MKYFISCILSFVIVIPMDVVFHVEAPQAYVGATALTYLICFAISDMIGEFK